jgi:Antitoxin Xre-like helix-turn-helix domain
MARIGPPKNLSHDAAVDQVSSTFILNSIGGWPATFAIIMFVEYDYSIFGMSTQTLQLPGIPWDHATDLSSRAVQARLSPAATRAFFRIAQAWKLRDEDARALLGGISNGAYYNLKNRPAKKLDQDRLTRVSLLIGIFKALNILYSRKLADTWIQLANTNPIFVGATPLSYMLKGGLPAIIRVRQLLDARRGGT